MNSRRDFIKGSLAAGLGAAALGATAGETEAAPLPKGIVYTQAEPGRWKGKAGSHAPVVVVDGNRVTVETRHGMSPQHYIVRHTLVSATGEVLGEKTFTPAAKEAKSVFEVHGHTARLFATSFCNQHDFWVTEVRR